MARVLVPKGGNDNVQTPPELGKKIINHYNPTGKILEPCRGNGLGFYQYMPTDALWCELTEGKNFFDFDEKVDWIITNPPFSKLRHFLEHSMSISNNIVFLCLVPNAFYRARIELSRKHGFGIKELIYIPQQKPPFPKFGFQLGTVYWQKGWEGDIKVTDWEK